MENSGVSGNLLYEISFKVKAAKRSEFESHAKLTFSLLENHPGFVSASFSRLLHGENTEVDHFRVEIVFENQASIDSYQKDIVPKVREQGANFGEDAKVETRRTYEIFASTKK